MHVTKWKQRRFPYNPNKPKVIRFGATVQPHAKDCLCSPCKAYQKALRQVIGNKAFNARNKPVEQGFFRKSATPDHVVRRARLHQTLSRFTFSN